jgi:UDP-glucose 4-epimerase
MDETKERIDKNRQRFKNADSGAKKRFLITGGAGFIGSHLAEALLEKGHDVTVIDNLSTGRFENIEHLTGNSRFRFVIDSITNEVVLDRLTSECEVIFHLAAAVGVQLIVKNPVHTIETNVMGTEAILKAAVRYRAKTIIASTSEVYGKGMSVPFREDDDVVLGPTVHNRWAYASSKMIDEFLALAYHKEKALPVVICRLFNTVGPRQTGRYGMVIPRFVRQSLNGEPLTVYGDGRQSRCFCEVSDVVRAAIELADRPEAVGQVFNIGSDEEITIADLARKVLRLVDSMEERPPLARETNDRITFVPYDQAYELGFEDMQRRVPAIEKIRSLTGWEPKTSLDETLRKVIRSFQSSSHREE